MDRGQLSKCQALRRPRHVGLHDLRDWHCTSDCEESVDDIVLSYEDGAEQIRDDDDSQTFRIIVTFGHCGNQHAHIYDEYYAEEPSIKGEYLMAQISQVMTMNFVRKDLGFVSLPPQAITLF